MYTTSQTKRFLRTPCNSDMTKEYLLLGLSKGPEEGITLLTTKANNANGDEKTHIQQALSLLIANNNAIFPHTKRMTA